MAATGENTVRPSCLRLVPGVLTANECDLGLSERFLIVALRVAIQPAPVVDGREEGRDIS